eukprot:CAMPEP_0119511974 /NCGR_PEP_ID=MMETSP1344-20130328/30480_1 /TAXON_ID=236787 /ORGANISM="Florenciella parvula, Strain CCMP2471" /LENGTH=75 /DNA_ID=CAMNT_0007549037 /DNA_START=182 /DNA_END=406 /DNA_ORIENTATION=+
MSFAGNGGISPVQGFVESSIGLEAKLLQQDDSNSADDVAGDRGVALNIIILMGGLKLQPPPSAIATSTHSRITTS